MNANEVLEKIERQAEREFLPIIGPEKGKTLEKLVKEKRPKEAIEVGTLIGYSAIRIARSLEQGKLISVELNKENAAKAKENITKAKLHKKVTVLAGDAKEIIPKLNGAFDFVFLDANKKEYLTYLKLLEPKMNYGCYVVADNILIFREELVDYINYVRKSGKYDSSYKEIIDIRSGIKDAMEVSIKKF